jgi:anaerobic dimethyl sulfoxide reductase subunit C (anchor subunit)
MSNHWSLVMFTLLVQSAVGSVWCTGATLFLTGSRVGFFHYEWHSLSALLMVLAGLGASIAHLGRPKVCFYAIRNLRCSWLSREIAATGAFAGVLVVMVLDCAKSGTLNSWVVCMGSMVGGLVLYAMARAYRLRTVPSWNHVGTPLDFLGSALLLGGLQFMLVLNMLTAIQSAKYDASGADVFRNIAFIAVLVGFMLKLLAVDVNPSEEANSAGLFKTSQPVMQGCGTALCAVSMLSSDNTGFQLVLLSLAAVSLVAGETIHRVRFYDTYHRVGL